ncbi:MAG TPA: thioredoxin family protein [Nocardioides sp.]|uniref:TlpA family protein disulfide reductase n=1 Tax=Nocardioides sp. TaxID=35761 RepID=UPI002ED938B6
MTTGLWVALGAIAVALCFGGYRRVVDGRFMARSAGRAASASERVETPAAALATLLPQLGERATLVQFSTAFCAPCRATRRILGEVAQVVPGVAHVEIDAEQHLDVVRRLGVVRTPTTLVLDAAGREVARAAGAPRKEQVLSAIAAIDLDG